MFSGKRFSIFYFANLFLREQTAELTWIFISHTRVISPTCLPTGGTVIAQIEWETKMSAFNAQGLLVFALCDDMLAMP